jgi:HSP20 family protein
MMLARWDPITDLKSIEEEFDRMTGRPFSRNAWAPALDVSEQEDSFEVSVDLPGVKAEDVSVTYEKGTLTVSGKREFSSENKGQTWHRIERGYGAFARSIRLPQTADAEKIEAMFDKGVLTVSVPKTEAAKPRSIEVKAK